MLKATTKRGYTQFYLSRRQKDNQKQSACILPTFTHDLQQGQYAWRSNIKLVCIHIQTKLTLIKLWYAKLALQDNSKYKTWRLIIQF